MWGAGWRAKVWAELDQPWDVLVIGGGITGAGLFREATRLGLRTLLVEQRDFAWGTSSRSSKLVHGGLRYLKEGKIRLTRASVQERQQLLAEAPGLIDPLGFLLTIYHGDFPGRLTFGVGLTVYDLLALRWDHAYYSAEDFQMLAPHIARSGLQGGFRYGDAQTDDARLVLRIIREGAAGGGTAINYTSAEGLIRDEAGAVCGARLRDMETGRAAPVRARVVVNATGAWADRLRADIGGPARIRPLRGSHIIFPAWRVPVAQAVSFLHPIDRRPVFIFPWEGATLVGTTDVDCQVPLDREPHISPEEIAYLMAAVESQFPSLGIGLEDITSTFAGVRPVIGSGKANPSQESRDHVIWQEHGLLTVTGGKLTTFRLIAQDALRKVCACLPGVTPPEENLPVLDRVNVDLPGARRLEESRRQRLLGRYGADAPRLVGAAAPGELEPVPGTHTLWAELRWAARAEGVVHLDDLLLRRVRLGLLLPQGGAAWMPELRAICQPELGWDGARWETEQAAYLDLWRRCYSLPETGAIPGWRELLQEARAARRVERPRQRSFR
jgi:glycerol-3-phosphate dehydrogenase